MMIKKTLTFPLILFAVFIISGSADAELIKIGTVIINRGADGSRGAAGLPVSGGIEYNLIYEDDQGLIWLDYTNRDGRNWDLQMRWAAGLNEPGVLTYKLDPGISVSWKGDWRLPKTVDGARRFGFDGTSTAGFNITTSEMGHLFYVSLGNLGYYDTQGKPRTGWFPDSDWGLKNTGPFENLQTGLYWSCTEYGPYPGQHAWAFHFGFGDQSNLACKSSYPYSGLAFRPGVIVERRAESRTVHFQRFYITDYITNNVTIRLSNLFQFICREDSND